MIIWRKCVWSRVVFGSCLVMSLTISLAMSQTVFAGPYEDAEAAYRAGDHKKAAVFARKGVAQKHAKSQFFLGAMYEYGQGVEKSISMAAYWYQMAGNQGHAEAQYSLAYLYRSGHGGEKSDEYALVWFQKSARLGNANAQYFLGDMYERGISVVQSYDEALVWYRKAAKQGQEAATKRVDLLEEMYGTQDGTQP